MAASRQGAHLVSHVGLGASPSHALSIVALHFSSPSKEESKYMFFLVESVSCPHIVNTRGEWFKNLGTNVTASIRPTFESKS
jgi:hypothetical protein